jgi:Subtilase family
VVDGGGSPRDADGFADRKGESFLSFVYCPRREGPQGHPPRKCCQGMCEAKSLPSATSFDTSSWRREQAVEWAIEQKVDVISISWVTKQDNRKLREAIKKAVANNDPERRPILVFCSTADEGIYSGPVYPANHDGTVSVAAADRYGHLQPTSPGGVNILVPGDNVAADGPSYLEKYTTGTVSGSSVATASAAGIASLALLLLKTFNKCEERDFRDFYTRDGIMRVFNKMQGNSELTGIQLAGLFPERSNEHGKMLHNTWQLSKFPEIEKKDQG